MIDCLQKKPISMYVWYVLRDATFFQTSKVVFKLIRRRKILYVIHCAKYTVSSCDIILVCVKVFVNQLIYVNK